MAQEGLFRGNVEPVQLEDEIQRSYLDYSMSVIVGRALPDVRDGLKPVHKRILWAMLEAGYRPDRPHRKCAAVIGDVLKKYHPHGDQSVYDALVRMAQEWSLRYPLVDGHGNFGSVDGDPAAAYRYCVTGDTLLRRADGSSVAIADLAEGAQPGTDTPIDEKLLNRLGDPVAASMLFHSGTHETIQITTREGLAIRGTKNHPVLCLVSVAGVPMLLWKLLEEIRPGDRAVILRSAVEGSGILEGVPEGVPYLADYLNSDGENPETAAVAEPLVSGDHFYAEVVQVEDAGPASVYSVRVDSDDHAFITNGFVSHNTEARLAPMAMELLRDIDSETVDFVPNFDGYEQQPVVLPSRFPNLLVNGAGGIAVGMATNIPPHNLGEVIDGVVHYLDNPEATPSELMKFIKAPDFPTGGTIMGRQGIRDAYETGRGSLRVRAVTQIEESVNGKNKIVVTELPYQVNKARLAEKIAELVKTQKLKDVADLKDESNREGMRLVIETKRGANPAVVLNQLYKHTQLQDNFGVIMLALVDGVPRTLNLAEMVGYYVDHQVDVVTRRTRFDLRKAEERDHIVLGLLIALDHLDEVIKLIRASQDAEAARKKLMSSFKLSEIQANHILDMPLRRLTKLAREELDKEHAELLERIGYLTSLLDDPVKLRSVIKEELAEIRKKHADGRRTTVRADEGDFDVEDLIAEEDVVITVSRAGYVKRLPMDAFKPQGRGGKGVRGQNLKEEDVVKHVFTTTTHHWMLFFTTKGRVYRVKAHEIPESGRTARGMYAANLPGVALDGDERISAVIDLKEYDDGRYLLFATRKGIVKKTALPEYDSPRTGLIAINLRGDDELIDVKFTDGNDEVMMVSRKGQAIRFKESLSRPMGRATGGVIGMRLAEDDRVLAVGLVSEGEELISVTEQGYGKRSKLADYPLKGRGGKGVIGHQLTNKTGLLAGAYVGTKDLDMFVISSSGQVVRVPADQIRRVGRASQGVRTMRVEEGATVVALAPVITQMEDEDEE